LADRIAELTEQHGSLRAAARVLECDPGYLSRLASGEKCDPGLGLVRRMGLRQIITYERAGQQSERPAPAGQAVGGDAIHLAWRGALKACGVSEADRDAISQVVRDMLAASQAERPAVKEDKA